MDLTGVVHSHQPQEQQWQRLYVDIFYKINTEVTTLAASTAGLSWCIFDKLKTGKWSSLGFCSGVVSGLVAITPAAGFVAPWASIIIGRY